MSWATPNYDFWGTESICVYQGLGVLIVGTVRGRYREKYSVQILDLQGLASLQHEPHTPPKDVRYTWLKLSSFYLLVCHTIFHCLVFFTASPHYWHSSWLCTLCKSCKIRKNRGKNTQTFKWLLPFNWLIYSGCNPFNQNFQLEFPQSHEWMEWYFPIIYWSTVTSSVTTIHETY